MGATIIDGKQVAAEVRARVGEEVTRYVARAGRVPTLATVLVGADPASEIYVANKHRACEEAGMRSVHHGLPADTPQYELVELVEALGADDNIDGILVQLPVPDQIDPDAVIAALDPAKDVDGLTATNAGLLAGGTAGTGALHARRGDGAAGSRRNRAGRRRRRDRRPVEPGRAASGQPAAGP